MRERRPGVWTLEYRRRNKTYYGPKEQAARALKRFVIQVDDEPDEHVVSKEPVTLAKVAREWFDIHGKTIADNTRDSYEYYIRWFIATDEIKRGRGAGPTVGGLGSYLLTEISPSAIKRLYGELTAIGYEPATVHSVHNILGAIFNHALIDGYPDLARNPVDLVKAPKRVEKEHHCPTQQEVHEFVAAVDKLDKAAGVLVRIFPATGARRGEIAALRRRDVDLEAGSITIDEVATNPRGSSVKLEKRTKTGSGRGFRIDKTTCRALADMFAEQDAKAAKQGLVLGPDAFLFSPVSDHSKPYRPDGLSLKLRRLKESLEVEGYLHPHAYRHYSVTQLLMAGVSPAEVMQRHGHSSLQTVKKYTKWLVSTNEAPAAIIENLLRPPTGSAMCERALD
jgi:integrase